MLSQPQREELRFAVREQLVAAQTVALNADMVFRRVQRARAIDFTIDGIDILEALNFLESLGQAKAEHASLGATKYFQATAAGVLAHERGQ